MSEMGPGPGPEKNSWWSRIRNSERRITAAGYEDRETTDQRDERLERIKQTMNKIAQRDIRYADYTALRRDLAEADEVAIWHNTPRYGREIVAETRMNGEKLSPNQVAWQTLDKMAGGTLPRVRDKEERLHVVGHYSGLLPFELGKDSECEISIVPVADGFRYVARILDLNEPPRAYIMDVSPHKDDKTYGGEVPSHLIPELMKQLAGEPTEEVDEGDSEQEVAGIIPEIEDAAPSRVDYISQHPLTPDTVRELNVELQRIAAKVRDPRPVTEPGAEQDVEAEPEA